MNKLYSFLALVFLTACGSPGFEGNWIGDDNPEIELKISGNLMSITVDGESVDKCLVEEPNESSTRASCDGDELSMYLDGDVMVVTEIDSLDQITFSRN